VEEVRGSGRRTLRRQPARSSGDSRKLWRRKGALEEVSEALEEVEGSGGSQHEVLETTGSSGDGGKVRRRSKGLEEVEGSEAASTKLWRRQEALEAVEGSGGGLRGSEGGRRLWRRSKAVE
jgi:hypothetical protein